MSKQARKPSQPLARVIWANILRQQYLLGVNDAQLCEVLGITPRTLLNYQKDPTPITLKQLSALVDSFGLDSSALIQQF